ncbi:MAG TPA: amino acid adenylation domain-containing protein, partial [Longimicrobiaceae bacterium]|nr:amino acid adenylation domain-containing protein [Longimicrobiaceae bacterium]
GSTPAGVAALLHRQAAEALRDPLELDRDPPLRASLARVGAREHLLSIRVPALLADETTLRELPAEIGRAYAALAAGAELPGDPLQYADLAEWQNEALEGEGGAEGARHWARRAAPAPPLPETLGGVPADPGETRPEFLTLTLEPELAAALEGAAGACSATLPELLLGAVHVLLHRVTQRPETRVGVYFDGRGYEELRGALGPVGGYLPVDCRPDGGLAVAAVVEQLKREMEEAREWQGSFSPERVQVGSVGFAWHGEPPRASSGGVEFALRDAAAFAEPFALSLACTAGAGGLELRVYHDAARVAAVAAERFAEELHTLLRSIAARPDARICDLDVVGPRELRQVVEEWNRTGVEFPADRCIHQLFAEQAERTPHAVAIVYGDGALTYRELDQRANRLAHHLAGLGVGPEVRVGICLERSLELMVAILGVMKAGGAYVPVDPANPADRIGYVLEDSGVTALLTQARLRERMPVHDGVRVVEVDGEWGEAACPGAEPPASGVTAENLCYVIYTSGSTGRPKGVAMHHRGVCNYIHWGIPAYGADRGSGAPVFSSMAVDLTITNLLPLFAGRPVRFLREESSVEALAEALRERAGFGLIKITPTHLALLNPLLTPEEAQAAAATLVVGADLLNAEPTVFWQENAPGVRLMNEYGPTETVVGCSAYTLPNGVHRAGPVPVGGPIQNLTFFVLDERMQPVPVGSPGELYIGGVGVARGYLGRPALSAEKFVPDPFAEPGARMYRTGDRARWLEGGNLMILGRTDNQVKIRGYRVELGEVEAALLELPSVREAVVLAREDVPGERRLVAYLVPAAGEAPTTSELRASLLERVPEYMVPSVFVTLERLPLNTGGKLDRRALPEPGPERPELDQEYVAPRDDVEAALAEIWSEVLQVDVVGVRDDFFELGGNSFMAVRLMSRIEKRFGPALPLATLIQAGTIEKIAELLSTSDVEPRRDYLVPIQPGGSRPPLYCIHTGEGTVLCYRKLRELGPDQPVYGIQALDFDIGRKPLADVEKLAARYVDAIEEFQPEGPCLLA